MKIDTDFGSFEIDESDILHFKDGIYGFETDKEFILLSEDTSSSIFYLQSIQPEGPTFILIDPYTVFEEYDPQISPADFKEIESENAADLRFLLIAAIKEDPKANAVNLKSPIIINPTNKLAKQVILENQDYPVRYYFMDPERKGV